MSLDLNNPIVRRIISAQDALASSLCFAKSYCPREQAIQEEARVTLRQMREQYPTTYNLVRKHGMSL